MKKVIVSKMHTFLFHVVYGKFASRNRKNKWTCHNLLGINVACVNGKTYTNKSVTGKVNREDSYLLELFTCISCWPFRRRYFEFQQN